MSENVQAADAAVEESLESPVDYGEMVIGFLGGLVMGAIAYGVVIAIVGIVHASEPPGWTVAEVLDSLKLVPPPGVSVANIPTIILYPADNAVVNNVLNFILDYVSYLAGLVGTWWGYKKIMSLDGEK